MSNFDWDLIRVHLVTGTALITFKKLNGEIRTLECTLAEYLLPEVRTNRTPSAEVMVVFDLEANHWRSFRISSVTDVELL